jgi:adenine-specific DNA-methyltransferase
MKNLSIKGLPSDWFFPTTRYRGSKRKILPWIWENIKDLSFNSALDLFGGTSTVSLLFKRMGKQVTYNDYSYYNYLTGIAFIENKGTKLDEDDISFILKRKDLTEHFISKNFMNMYFREAENEWLDNAIENISALESKYSGSKLKCKQALAIWAVGQACLIKRPFNLFHRNNLKLRTRRVSREFGNKTTWETPFPVAFRRFADEANKVIFDNKRRNSSFHLNAFKFNHKDFDLVYLDPPYFFKDQDDYDYLRLYHFLDGFAQYKKWNKLIDYNSSIRSLKLPASTQWPAKSPEKLIEIYSTLISRFNKSIIVISHKAGSLVSVDTLCQILSTNGKTCVVHEKIYSYALNKQNGKSHDNVECLIIGK